MEDEEKAQEPIITSVSQIETWEVYEQQLRLLDRIPSLKKIRQEVACTMHIPNLAEPGSSFFHKVPLSLQSQWEKDLEDDSTFNVNPAINSKVSLWTGDLTEIQTDAIVNAINWNFENEGTGLNGLIHFKGGPMIMREWLNMNRIANNNSGIRGYCETGQTVVTKGYKLPCQYIFHTAPPTFRPLGNNMEELRSCYETSLQKLLDLNLRSIAFCCIGTGAKFGQPMVEAAHVALRTVRNWLEEQELTPTTSSLETASTSIPMTSLAALERVVFVVKNARQQEIYEQLMRVYFPCRVEEIRRPQNGHDQIQEQNEVALNGVNGNHHFMDQDDAADFFEIPSPPP